MPGKYIGTFGQKRSWNLKQVLEDTRPPPSQHRLPPDIKRVASFETLRLFNHGINSWKLAKNIMNILTIKNRIKNLKNAFSMGSLGKKKSKEPTELEERVSLDAVQQVEAKQSKQTDTKKAPSSLGIKSPSVLGVPGLMNKRKSFMGTAKNVIQINALTKPEESIEDKYEACLERLGKT